jgi:molybdopterin converting factor subunit 1
MTIHLRLRYFAALRETIGASQEEWDLPPGATIALVRQSLITRYPATATIVVRCVAAHNRAFAPDDTALADGDEIVFLPPMAGG